MTWHMPVHTSKHHQPLEPFDEFDPLSDFDMTGGDDVWFARPQLFFLNSLCPTGQMEDMSSHREVSLVFFSTFEPIPLPRDSYLQKSGIPMLFEPAASQLPNLYVCPVENILGSYNFFPPFGKSGKNPSHFSHFSHSSLSHFRSCHYKEYYISSTCFFNGSVSLQGTYLAMVSAVGRT